MSVVRRDLRAGHFSITIERLPEGARAELVGELDLYGTELLADITEEVLEWHPPPRNMVLDLSGLVFADLVGVRGLVDSCRLLSSVAATVSVAGIPRKVQRVLALSGIDLPEHVSCSVRRSTADRQ